VDFDAIQKKKREDELRAIRDEQFVSRTGRPRLGKTHVHSKEGKRRRNAISKSKRLDKKGRRSAYRFKGFELLFNVLDIAYVPKERYLYHQRRYLREGKAFSLRQAWGFKLPNSRKCNLPSTVIQSLIGIYSNPVLVPVKTLRSSTRKGPTRAPRRRTRSDSLSRAISAFEECIKDDVANIVKRPGLLARLTAEAQFRYRDDPKFALPSGMVDILNDANNYIKSKEFNRAIKEDGGWFTSKEISDEINGVISLQKAREELKTRRRRNRVLRAPDGSTIEWF
jgi:hypothetical protein